jgi:hypothetical protein
MPTYKTYSWYRLAILWRISEEEGEHLTSTNQIKFSQIVSIYWFDL